MVEKYSSRGRNGNQWTLFIWAVVFILFLDACGEEEAKVHRVGILSGLDFTVDIAAGFKAEMTELGYEDGRNIVYDLQKVNFDPARTLRSSV